MVSFKLIAAALALTGALAISPAVSSAKLPSHPVKHLTAKKHPVKVHRKHATALSAHKKLSVKGHKPLTASHKTVSKAGTTGWKHHPGL